MYEICDPMTGKAFFTVRWQWQARLVCWFSEDFGCDWAKEGEGWL